MAAESIIVFENVHFSFNGKRPVFQGCSLSLEKGGFYLVRGPSGAGKSTFLRMINRLEAPESGRILFKGLPLDSQAPPLLRRTILYIQQTPTVIDSTVRDNILLPFTFKINQQLHRPDDEKIEGLMREFMLDDVGLSDNALNLSVGQKQRLCFIRGMVLSPEILLLDEPVSSLDKESAAIVEKAIEDRAAAGLTIIMVSHHEYNPPRRLNPLIIEVPGFEIKKAY